MAFLYLFRGITVAKFKRLFAMSTLQYKIKAGIFPDMMLLLQVFKAKSLFDFQGGKKYNFL